MEIYFVTSNENKILEAREILRRPIHHVSLDIPEIQSLEVDDVVKEKARFAYEIIHKPVLVEDTGLYIHSLGGFPGALAKWVQESAGFDWLCRSVGNDRSAYVKTSVCFYDEKGYSIFHGIVLGRIASSPRGRSGFGWDSIFIPQGFEKTFAQMGQEEKNKISMRRRAFEKMKTSWRFDFEG